MNKSINNKSINKIKYSKKIKITLKNVKSSSGYVFQITGPDPSESHEIILDSHYQGHFHEIE